MASRLRELRESMNLSLSQVAARAGVSKATLSRAERRPAQMKLDTFRRIADAYSLASITHQIDFWTDRDA